ncbi:uncharacterized protein ASCRUDRAFT_74400 [Ascoidea rubescens DSM 1968]|uniref:Uncharacterized protein n=1 Tax=Ascoidea rubescens DSM 1968 TaxID=1344418 RepID=A0A1D2VMX1_9ASCO|nr:hypothetical protein ASCRUDRAFT_74400 [Ascoidea rubescens DSM 1968]ODV62962.1 hypothetical protein ASCRUDRAFT_74400 [Ascoidea rubescens DSM 1968]
MSNTDSKSFFKRVVGRLFAKCKINRHHPKQNKPIPPLDLETTMDFTSLIVSLKIIILPEYSKMISEIGLIQNKFINNEFNDEDYNNYKEYVTYKELLINLSNYSDSCQHHSLDIIQSLYSMQISGKNFMNQIDSITNEFLALAISYQNLKIEYSQFLQNKIINKTNSKVEFDEFRLVSLQISELSNIFDKLKSTIDKY